MPSLPISLRVGAASLLRTFLGRLRPDKTASIWAVLLALAVSGATFGASAEERVLRMAVVNMPASFGDPFRTVGIPGDFIWRQIFDPLTESDADGRIVPLLAQSWANLDPLTWRFELRKDVRYSNGRPFAAAAAREVFEWLLSEEGQATVVGADVRGVSRVEAPDPGTLILVTRKPDPILPNRLTVVMMIDPQAFRELGRQGFSRTPVGAGSYRVEDWQNRNGAVLLTPNPHAWRPPSTKRVEIYPLRDHASWFQAALSGQLEITMSLRPEQAGSTPLEFSVERALFARVAHRACAPSSKLHCHEQWLAEDVRIQGCGELKRHHLYRAMDFLHAHQAALEEGLYYRVADRLNLDVELVFYDTTSLHFEIADEDGEDPEGPPLRKRGHSKNGRGAAPQVLVGLAVTREGFPVRHWVFPGNPVDVSTVAKVKRDLKGWRRNRCVFVGDAGMVSAEHWKALARGGGRYIVCMPVRRGGEADRVIGRRGRYREVAKNLHVKEVVVGEGERRRRYAVCLNPREAERQRRAKVLAELEAELASLRPSESGPRKRACEWRASGRYGRYVRLTKTGLLRIEPGQGQGGGTPGRQVRRSQQRRHAPSRGHGLGLQAAAARRAGVAAPQERA